MTKDEYEKDLRRKQELHLQIVKVKQEMEWQPCMHDQCVECFGTGIKIDGSPCIHSISCPCPKCTPR